MPPDPRELSLPCTGTKTPKGVAVCGRVAHYSHQNRVGWVYKCSRKTDPHFFTVLFPKDDA